jgi:hypothetical protein
MSNEDRLKELRGKETLTDDEMKELIRLSPPSTFKSLPDMQTLGVTDIECAFQNFKEGAERSKHAFESGCYLEVISLRLQHTEFWLRMFWVAKNRKGKVFDPNDKRTFGAIINDCSNLGFRTDLLARLKDFNEHRINAIHKYLLGATDYDELKKVCESNTGLDREVGEYVANEIGIVIS